MKHHLSVLRTNPSPARQDYPLGTIGYTRGGFTPSGVLVMLAHEGWVQMDQPSNTWKDTDNRVVEMLPFGTKITITVGD